MDLESKSNHPLGQSSELSMVEILWEIEAFRNMALVFP